MNKRAVVAVDIGTTSTKALAVDLAGRTLASRSEGYPLLAPKPGYAEQDPDAILAAALRAVAETLRDAGLSAEEIACVSFSSAMHGLIAVDRGGRPITPCVTWADQRAKGQADRLRASGEGLEIYKRTGTPIHPMSPLCKLMWFRENRPDLFAAAHKFIGIKEYIFWHLFGRYAVDYSVASATGMFNLEGLRWDEGALAACGVTADRLSEPVPTTAVFESGGRDWPEEISLLRAIPFVIGASDGVLANLGSGATDKGVAAVTIGTSGAMRTTVDRPLIHPQGALFCYCLTEDRWVVGGPTNNGGLAMQWLRDLLRDEDGDDAGKQGAEQLLVRMTEWAEQTAPGADGLLCLPLFTGERAPYWNANARGAFFGLTLAHGKPHMVRAVMEGVLFQIAHVFESLHELTDEVCEIRGSGGFAHSELWRQMLADVIGVPVVIPEDAEGSALGAAKLGAYAVGAIPALDPDWGESKGTRYEPNPAHADVYRKLRKLHRRLYERLGEGFDEIVAFQQGGMEA